VGFDGGLPAGGVGADQGSGRTDVGGQKARVVPVRGLVQVPADPHRTTAPVQRRLNEVRDLNTAEPLCHSLAVAVQRLETRSDADYGTTPRASFELAARLEDCAAASP
jgi:hypothetical protein